MWLRTAIAALSIATAVATPAAAQPLVRVRAETRIELRPRRDGEQLIVGGTLRDDLGEPMRDRALTLEVREGEARGPRRALQPVRTDGSGRFEAAIDLPLGVWWVIAEHAGDEHYQRHEVARQVLLDRAHVLLDVEIEGGARIDLDRAEHAMRIRARSDAGGEGLEIVVSENGRELARGRSDASGELPVTLRSSELGPPSASRLVVRSAPDAHRADAQTEVPIVRFRASTLTLEGSRTEVGPGQSVRLEGRLATSEGALSRKAVGLWAGDRHLATALTDEQGRYAATLGFAELGALDGEVVARFESDAPWWGASESGALPLRVETPGATPWSWIALSIAICALLFALAGRRRRTAAPPGGAELPVTAPAIELAARKSLLPDSLEIAGRVVDARGGGALVGARVRSQRGETTLGETTTDGAGHFAIALGAGVHSIEIEVDGYEPARHRATLPHRGEWSSIVVRLRSLRELAWEPLEPIAARLLPTPDLWGVWTARDLEAAARARRGSPRALPGLIASIERAAYAPEPPSAADLDAIRRAARAIESEMAAPPPPPVREDRSAR